MNNSSKNLEKTNLEEEGDEHTSGFVFQSNINQNPTINFSTTEFEKLKEDYFTLYEEKKGLEIQLLETLPYEAKFKEVNEKLSNIQVQFDNINSKSIQYFEERNSLQERLNKISLENFELVQNINTLKESLNNSEKDKNGAKNKITTANNRVKILDKEILNLKKKTQNLNFQIKDLKVKLKEEQDSKVLMEKKLEDIIQEFENKLANKESEKQKILKDSLTHLINAINDESCLEFTYNSTKDKIEIYFEKSKITEVDNIKQEDYEKNNNSNSNETNTTGSGINSENYNSNCNNLQLNTSNSILYLKTDVTEVNSPTKWKTNKKKLFDIYSENENSRENGKAPSGGISLQKLFSKSRSSQKPYVDSHQRELNKENISIFSNNIGGAGRDNTHYNQKTNNIMLLNLSSNKKKQKTEYSKLDRGLSSINNFAVNQNYNVNPFSNIDNCIRKTNLNNNLRFVLSSNNRHKKVVSLDQALGNEDVDAEEENKKAISIRKALNFNTISHPLNFQIDAFYISETKIKEVSKYVNLYPQFENELFVLREQKNKTQMDSLLLPYNIQLESLKSSAQTSNQNYNNDFENSSKTWIYSKSYQKLKSNSFTYGEFLFFKDYLI